MTDEGDTVIRFDLSRYFECLITGHRMKLRESVTEAERLTLALNSRPEKREVPRHEDKA